MESNKNQILQSILSPKAIALKQPPQRSCSTTRNNQVHRRTILDNINSNIK